MYDLSFVVYFICRELAHNYVVTLSHLLPIFACHTISRHGKHIQLIYVRVISILKVLQGYNMVI